MKRAIHYVEMRHNARADGRHSVLGRAMLIIDAFQLDDSTLTLAELTHRTGLPKPPARRLIRELAEAGLLEYTPDGVRLGLRLLELGAMVQSHSPLCEVAQPYLRELAATTGQTVHLGVLTGGEVLYLEKLTAPAGPPAPTRAGRRMPAYCTGLGKAMLASSPPEVVATTLRQPLRRLTPRTLTLPGQLAQELDRVRARGIAFDHEEAVPGVVCAAAPILDPAGDLVGGLSVTGWSARLNPGRLAGRVARSAELISSRLAAVAADRSTARARAPRAAAPAATG